MATSLCKDKEKTTGSPKENKGNKPGKSLKDQEQVCKSAPAEGASKKGRKPSASIKEVTGQEKEQEKEKDYYKVLNSRVYNEGLVNRGDFTLLLDDDMYAHWAYQGVRSPGGAILYSDQVIELGLSIRKLFKLPYRQTQGFLRGLMSRLGWAVPIPNYSTLNRRASALQVEIAEHEDGSSAEHVSMDSTGLKVSGESEWRVRKYGKSKRRTWRKLHVVMDLSTYQIIDVVLTPNSVDDGSVAEQLLEKITPCTHCSCYADGAYDQERVRIRLYEKGIEQIIPPQRGAVVHAEKPHMKERNQAIAFIAEDKEKRTQWKQHKDYHQRSRVEVGMFRLKSIFGHKLLSKKMPYQITEVQIAVKLLNLFTRFGMPVSVKIDRQKKQQQQEQKRKIRAQKQQQKQIAAR